LNSGLCLLVNEERHTIAKLRDMRNEITHAGVSAISAEIFYRYVNGIRKLYSDLNIPSQSIRKLNKLAGD